MIYVDQLVFQKKNGKKLYCHMLADSIDELHAFACLIGRKRCWFHKSSYLHYDLDVVFRDLAIQAGAIEIDSKDIVYARKLSLTIGEFLVNISRSINQVTDDSSTPSSTEDFES
jgi:hypothetical protein